MTFACISLIGSSILLPDEIAEQINNFASGFRQHSHSWFRALSGAMIIFFFVPSPLTNFEMAPPFRRGGRALTATVDSTKEHWI
jgi:hypothetical protein